MTQPTREQLEHQFELGLTIEDLARMYQVRVSQIRELLEQDTGGGGSTLHEDPL